MNSTDLINVVADTPVQLNYADTCWILVIQVFNLFLGYYFSINFLK
jgi:hypothetical protein